MGLEVRELICKLGLICAGADGKLGNEEGAPYNAIHVGAAAAGMHMATNLDLLFLPSASKSVRHFTLTEENNWKVGS